MDEFYVFHNSQDIYYRNPFGAVKCGSKVFIRIEAEGCSEATLVISDINENLVAIPMDFSKGKEFIKGENPSTVKEFCVELNLKEIGIYNYYFILKKNTSYFYYGNNKDKLGGVGELYPSNPKAYQITVYKDFKVPEWYKEGIMYQIFPDSFYRGEPSSGTLFNKKNALIYSNWFDEPIYIRDEKGEVIRWAFYGGNLKGIILKLPYLKSLGVSILYLNPVFESSSVHRYNTGDYLKIDSILGDDDDFKELCKVALDNGIRIILDGVFNHTGDDSIYFNKYLNYDNVGAYQGHESVYFKWYNFNNFPDEYDCWWGIKSLPSVNELEPSYMDFILYSDKSVIKKWMKLGVSGWRLDVADELPDEFIEALNKKIKELKSDGVIIGEIWEDASNKVSYNVKRRYLLGNELDSVMNYPFREGVIDFFTGKIDSFMFRRKMMSLYENYPKESFYSNMNLLGSHDTERIFTILYNYTCNKEVAIGLLKLASLLQMCFPGVPCIYYGDEAALEGGKDPHNRKAFPWGKENLNLLEWYKAITSLRNRFLVFKRGDFQFIDLHEDIICFERKYLDEKVIVLLNRNVTESVDIEFKPCFKGLREIEDILFNNKNFIINDGYIKLSIKLTGNDIKIDKIN
ncbi:alpha-amylase [Fervidicella metallireducens AeB]|uniref:Alpha-amylase n=1 Tax=Fervidicella metallireducens AeB TaxID=1403537 RepID=A0A017RSM8_9CLOT|nr:alpha-amylase family glycosyl hydrolase [Fervidicella metallireducens]EYE87773.1 alpha-amylase [Fervidicella metallireducens AeB]